MKFRENKYLKARGDCCDFIGLLECIEDTGKSAEVLVYWYQQSFTGWRQISTESRFKISERDYTKWVPYSPRGKRLDN